jgi:hypothetical protein
MMRAPVTYAALAAALLLAACGNNFKSAQAPELGVVMNGEDGKSTFTFTSVAPGATSKVEVSLINKGDAALEIYDLNIGTFTKTDAGDSGEGTFALKNEVADESTLVVRVDDAKCSADGNWTFDATSRTVTFLPDGDCPVVIGTPVSVEYLAMQNPYVTLALRGKEAPTDDAPYVFAPSDENPYQSYDFDIVYTPGDTPEGGDFAVVVRSNDEDFPEKSLLISVSAPAPKVVIYPPSKVFLNPTYECQEFQVKNTGNADLVFKGVTLETTSAVFAVTDWPNAGDTVAPNGTPLTFKVCYTPKGDTREMNTVLVQTNDPLNPDAKVAVSNSPQTGAYTIDYADEAALGYMDFTGVEHGTVTKDITFYVKTKAECQAEGTECGGVVKINDLTLDPSEAGQAYTWVLRKVESEGVYTDITTSETKDQLIATQKYLTAVGAGKAVQVSVTYNADVFVSGMNGTLEFNLATPFAGSDQVSLFGGTPKGQFDLAPSSYDLHYNTTAQEAKSLSTWLYNTGNGPLTVKGIVVKGEWSDTTEDFTLDQAAQAAGFEIPPFSIVEVPVTFQYKSGDTNPAGALVITYVDDQIGDIEAQVTLNGHPDLGIAYPVAQASATGTPTAGTPLTLSGAGSTPTPGASIDQYLWYLTAKPAGSKAHLNEAIYGSDSVSFTPDVAGSYTVALIVFNTYSSTGVFSDPGFLPVTVQ